MSGGSLNYASFKIDRIKEDLLEEVKNRDIPQDVLNEILRWENELQSISKAMHSIEWYLSGDTGKNEFLKEIKEVV